MTLAEIDEGIDFWACTRSEGATALRPTHTIAPITAIANIPPTTTFRRRPKGAAVTILAGKSIAGTTLLLAAGSSEAILSVGAMSR
jgi:hypothetical protein